MPPLATHSSDELIRFIEAAGESANIDAKGPMEWDGGEASAGLTKDILALANCRDGGVIVLGKQESQPGNFVLAGLSEQQASSLETTKVATWVNNHCSPPVNLVCYRQKYRSRAFIVIAVSEFHDVPVICTKEFTLAGKPQRFLLRKGAVYVSTANSESAPLSSVEELRQLVGLATTKRADQMLAMFQAMLKGRPLLAEKSDVELFLVEREEVRAALNSEFKSQSEQGAWTFICHPVRYLSNRWEETHTLKAVLDRSVVRVRREFPPISYGTHVREWGICNQHYGDAFGLTRSGLFMATRLFWENRAPFKHKWQPIHGERYEDIPAGQWFDFNLNLSLVIEFFLFLSRFADNFEVGEEVVYELSAAPLSGRRLTMEDSGPWRELIQPCRAGMFRRKQVVSVEALRASWEEQCAKALHGLFELFPGPGISTDTLMQWVRKFKERKL